MSVERCWKCEKDIDTDFDLGNYCPLCDAFICDDCVEGERCPICGEDLEL